MANRYYVPGGSEYFSNTNNWSTSSGGSGGASVPSSGDTAIFDENSFGVEGQIVIVDIPVLCHINTTGALPFQINITNLKW